MRSDVLSFWCDFGKGAGTLPAATAAPGGAQLEPCHPGTEMVPGDDSEGSLPAGAVRAGSLQCASEVLIRCPEQTACHRPDHTLGLPACPWHLSTGLGRPLSSWPGLALPVQPLTMALRSALPGPPLRHLYLQPTKLVSDSGVTVTSSTRAPGSGVYFAVHIQGYNRDLGPVIFSLYHSCPLNSIDLCGPLESFLPCHFIW